MSSKFVKINSKIYQSQGIDMVEILPLHGAPVKYFINVVKLPVIGANGQYLGSSFVSGTNPSITFDTYEAAEKELNKIMKELA